MKRGAGGRTSEPANVLPVQIKYGEWRSRRRAPVGSAGTASQAVAILGPGSKVEWHVVASREVVEY